MGGEVRGWGRIREGSLSLEEVIDLANQGFAWLFFLSLDRHASSSSLPSPNNVFLAPATLQKTREKAKAPLDTLSCEKVLRILQRMYRVSLRISDAKLIPSSMKCFKYLLKLSLWGLLLFFFWLQQGKCKKATQNEKGQRGSEFSLLLCE